MAWEQEASFAGRDMEEPGYFTVLKKAKKQTGKRGAGPY